MNFTPAGCKIKPGVSTFNRDAYPLIYDQSELKKMKTGFTV
jgi:hypothetical protein